MEFLIAGLLVVNLAAVVLGAQLLREEISAQANAWLASEADTVKSLSGLWKESQRQTAALQSLLGRGDASEAVNRLAQMLEDSPAALSREQESALSKAMEEGISSILGYTAGKGSEGGA